MEFGFVIHYKLRKGLGPEWVNKTAEFYYDDLPIEATYEWAKEMAIADFKVERTRNGTHEREYYITDIVNL
jgi:hypothetical protein